MKPSEVRKAGDQSKYACMCLFFLVKGYDKQTYLGITLTVFSLRLITNLYFAASIDDTYFLRRKIYTSYLNLLVLKNYEYFYIIYTTHWDEF